jgi:hypothetical protein
MTTTKTRADARTFKGLPVVDATKSHDFRVVDKDGGTPFKADDCKAYHALERAFPGATIAIYGSVTLIEMQPGTVTRFQNNRAMRKAIEQFDKTGEFPAGDYTLAPVPPTRTLGARSAENKARGDQRKGREKQTTNTGLANGKPPVIGRGRPTYDKPKASASA